MAQANAVLSDSEVAAVKLGMLGSADIAQAVKAADLLVDPAAAQVVLAALVARVLAKPSAWSCRSSTRVVALPLHSASAVSREASATSSPKTMIEESRFISSRRQALMVSA